MRLDAYSASPKSVNKWTMKNRGEVKEIAFINFAVGKVNIHKMIKMCLCLDVPIAGVFCRITGQNS